MVWSLLTDTCICTLNGHTVSVLSFICVHAYIDSCVCVYVHIYIYIYIYIYTHTHTCIHIQKYTYIYIHTYTHKGSDDHSIKIWSLLTGTCIRTLNGHTDSVLSLIVAPKGCIWSSSTDKTVWSWGVDLATSGTGQGILSCGVRTCLCMCRHAHVRVCMDQLDR
jgi:WD40 repeat protein